MTQSILRGNENDLRIKFYNWASQRDTSATDAANGFFAFSLDVSVFSILRKMAVANVVVDCCCCFKSYFCCTCKIMYFLLLLLLLNLSFCCCCCCCCSNGILSLRLNWMQILFLSAAAEMRWDWAPPSSSLDLLSLTGARREKNAKPLHRVGQN